jgi:hypothetical protein
MIERSRIHQRVPTSAKEGRRLRTALVLAQRRIRELHEEREEARRDVAELRRVIAAQARRLGMLSEEVELISRREQELRAMLLSAHDQLMRRAEEIKADLGTKLQQSAPQQDVSHEAHSAPGVPAAVYPIEKNSAPAGAYAGYEQLNKLLAYRWVVGRIPEVANAALPLETTVAVVSKGDEELLELGGGRQGWHFPQDDEGAYAGHYPADSVGAISHLEELREKGAEFLLFPATAFWWLERYSEFGEHLDSHYRRVWEDKTFIIYQLREAQTTGEGGVP